MLAGRGLLLPVLALASTFFVAVQSTFVIEGAGLKIAFPPAAKAKYPDGFQTALANFGAPKYGGAVM